jgi:hypothetical protein
LEERQTLLSLQETDMEVWEAKLTEEHVRGLHSFDKRDLSVELEEIRVRVVEVEDECATEAREMSQFILEISNALVDIGMLPIRDIPQLSNMAQEVLAVADLILEHL